MMNQLNINKMKNMNYKAMRITLFILVFMCGFGYIAQAQSTNATDGDDIYKNMNLTAKDSLIFEYLDAINMKLGEHRYQLYKTQNMWTFLKLDTMTGQIWQVQFSIKGSEYRYETPLDLNIKISEYFDVPIHGRFTLYATDNMYNFILLDQIDGRCWQVQWNTEPENRGVLRIY